MTRYDLVRLQEGGAPVQRLPAENATEGAVVGLADVCDDFIHCPVVEVPDKERQDRGGREGFRDMSRMTKTYGAVMPTQKAWT